MKKNNNNTSQLRFFKGKEEFLLSVSVQGVFLFVSHMNELAGSRRRKKNEKKKRKKLYICSSNSEIEEKTSEIKESKGHTVDRFNVKERLTFTCSIEYCGCTYTVLSRLSASILTAIISRWSMIIVVKDVELLLVELKDFFYFSFSFYSFIVSLVFFILFCYFKCNFTYFSSPITITVSYSSSNLIDILRHDL